MTDKKATEENPAAPAALADGFAGVQDGDDVYFLFSDITQAVLSFLGDTDGTLAANLDTLFATQKAVKTAIATGDAATLAAAEAYADGLVVGLWDDRGTHNASGNTFPSSGGSGAAGAIKKGDIWTISVAGTLGGHAVTAGDTVRALVDTPGSTDANWAIGENNIGYVPENVASKDASGGYAGLTLFKLNLRNAANTITSWFTNAATVARTWTLPDKDGTVAMTSDITGTNSGTNTGDETTTTAGALINGATSKTTPVDADYLGLMDSAASNVLKKLSWANLKATLRVWLLRVQVLTDGATISVDASLGDNCRVVLGGNRTLANPTNLTDGQVLNFRIHQDGTGSRTLAYGTKYKFAGGVAPVLSTAASSKDFMSCQYDATDDTLYCSTLKAFA